MQQYLITDRKKYQQTTHSILYKVMKNSSKKTLVMLILTSIRFYFLV